MENERVMQPKIKDIMTADVVAAFEDELVVDVARRIFERDFNGLPVIDLNKKLVGIVTQYDLISKGVINYVPAFIKLVEQSKLSQEEKTALKKEVRSILELKVRDVMNKEVLFVGPDESIEGLAKIFADHHRVNPIPVVGEKGELLGIVSRHDLIKFLAGPQGGQNRARKSIDAQIGDFMDYFKKWFAPNLKLKSSWPLFSVIVSLAVFFLAFALIFGFVIK